MHRAKPCPRPESSIPRPLRTAGPAVAQGGTDAWSPSQTPEHTPPDGPHMVPVAQPSDPESSAFCSPGPRACISRWMFPPAGRGRGADNPTDRTWPSSCWCPGLVLSLDVTRPRPVFASQQLCGAPRRQPLKVTDQAHPRPLVACPGCSEPTPAAPPTQRGPASRALDRCAGLALPAPSPLTA